MVLKMPAERSLIGTKMGPTSRDKTTRVYPSLKGAQTSPLVTEMGLLMHAQADSAMCSGCLGYAQKYSPLV